MIHCNVIKNDTLNRTASSVLDLCGMTLRFDRLRNAWIGQVVGLVQDLGQHDFYIFAGGFVLAMLLGQWPQISYIEGHVLNF
jgi:hypothetical protein